MCRWFLYENISTRCVVTFIVALFEPFTALGDLWILVCFHSPVFKAYVNWNWTNWYEKAKQKCECCGLVRNIMWNGFASLYNASQPQAVNGYCLSDYSDLFRYNSLESTLPKLYYSGVICRNTVFQAEKCVCGFHVEIVLNWCNGVYTYKCCCDLYTLIFSCN